MVGLGEHLFKYANTVTIVRDYFDRTTQSPMQTPIKKRRQILKNSSSHKRNTHNNNNNNKQMSVFFGTIWVVGKRNEKDEQGFQFPLNCVFGPNLVTAQTSEGMRASRGYFRSQLRSDGKVVVTLSAQLFLFLSFFSSWLFISLSLSHSLFFFSTCFSKIVLCVLSRRSNSCTSPFLSICNMDNCWSVGAEQLRSFYVRTITEKAWDYDLC